MPKDAPALKSSADKHSEWRFAQVTLFAEQTSLERLRPLRMSSFCRMALGLLLVQELDLSFSLQQCPLALLKAI